jgi:hypothetical protein
MAVRGRPPKPIEVKRRNGNPGKRPLPEPGTVVALPLAADVPNCPDDLGLEGRQLWNRAWDAAITWLSPASDMEAIEQACRIADDLEIARHRYRATRDPGDGRMVVQFSKAMTDALSALGFDPTSRSRLGVAEVKRASALDELIARRASR